MNVEKYTENGCDFRTIISRRYNALRALEHEYQKIGKRTWFNLYNSCEGTWILTVEMGEVN